MVAGGGDRDDRHGGQGGVHGDQRDNSPAPERQTQDGDQGQTGRASVLHMGGSRSRLKRTGSGPFSIN